MFDGEAFGAEIVDAVRGHVERVTAPLLARIAELEARAAIPGPPGERGADGRDGLAGLDGAPGELGPAGADGKDGKDAEPLTREQVIEAVLAMPDALDEAVRRHLEANPPAAGLDGKDGLDGAPGAPGEPGRDGLDGKDGEPGRDGLDGKDGLDGAPGEPGRDGLDGIDGVGGRDGLDGKDGLDGRDGLDGVGGRDGLDGKDGLDGRDGADGVGVAGAFKDHEGALILTLTNGETRNLGQITGKDGRDGVDGRDGAAGERGPAGFGLSDFDTEMKADDRTVLFKFTSGDVTEIHELCFPVPIDRGVYKADAAYARGDGVTWGGSSWTAQRDVAPGEKPEASDAWRLAVKRGRDGKDGKDGKPGEKGAPGKDGRGF